MTVHMVNNSQQTQNTRALNRQVLQLQVWRVQDTMWSYLLHHDINISLILNDMTMCIPMGDGNNASECMYTLPENTYDVQDGDILGIVVPKNVNESDAIDLCFIRRPNDNSEWCTYNFSEHYDNNTITLGGRPGCRNQQNYPQIHLQVNTMLNNNIMGKVYK